MKNWKRAFSLVLVMISMLSLAACGKQAGDSVPQEKSGTAELPSTAEPAEEYVYKASFHDVDLTGCNVRYLGPSFFTDDAVYAIGSELVGKDIPEGKTEEYAGQYDVYENRIVRITFDGKAEVIPYTPLSVERDLEGKYEYDSATYSQGLRMLSDGNLAEIAVFYDNWGTVEGIAREDEEFWNHYEYSQQYYYRVLNPDGTEKLKSLIPVGEDDYLNAVGLDAKENFICCFGSYLCSINQEGKILWTLETDDYIDGIAELNEGTVYAVSWGNSGIELKEIDTEKGEFGAALKGPSDAYMFCTGGGEYPLYYSSGSNFFGLNPETGEKEKLFSWLNTDVASEMGNILRITDDGTVIGMLDNSTYEGNTYIPSYQIFEVRRVPMDSAAKKQSITLATQWLPPEISKEVLKFNRRNDKVHIDIIDYSQYNTEEDYSAGLTKLQTEMMAGNIPDIVDLNGMAVSRLAARGILEDLYPYLDADEGISRDDFFPNILHAVEQNGKLVSTIPGFSIMSLLGASSVVGDEPGWTYSEFEAALANMPEGCRPLSVYTTREEVLRSCLGLDLNRFVDWSTGECRFDSEEYRSLLEFVKPFPETYDWDTYNFETDSDQEGLATGQQMLVYAGVSSVDDVLYNQIYFGKQPYTYIGYPTSSGTGNYIYVGSGLAMTSACTNKEEVWQFLRTFFTEDYQKSLYTLPISIKAYESKLADVMTVHYHTDSEGEYMLDQDGNRIPEVKVTVTVGTDQIELYALSQEDADKLTELIRTTTRTLQTDDSIFSIVKEQAEAFFQGQKSVEEVARLTQSKANIYVNEQR